MSASRVQGFWRSGQNHCSVEPLAALEESDAEESSVLFDNEPLITFNTPSFSVMGLANGRPRGPRTTWKLKRREYVIPLLKGLQLLNCVFYVTPPLFFEFYVTLPYDM